MSISFRTLILVIVLSTCSQSENAMAQLVPGPARRSQEGTFALDSAATRGGLRVVLRSLPTAGPVITLVGQLDYDGLRLSLRSCEIGSQIGAGTTAGKVLHFAEPAPGVVRTVIEGGLQVIPESTEVLTCTFAARPGGPSGPAVVRAQGTVADMTLADRRFQAETTVMVRRLRRSAFRGRTR